MMNVPFVANFLKMINTAANVTVATSIHVTNSMGQKLSSDANNPFKSQGIPLFLCNLNVCYHVDKSLPVSLRSILMLSSFACLEIPSVLFPSNFQLKSCQALFIFPVLDTCPFHILDLSTITLFHREHKS